jgi:mono/diheme cytochrome c family protein
MTRGAVLALGLIAAWPHWAAAQAAPTEQQGHRLFLQSCGVCHTKPNLVAGLYGPALNKDTVTGKEEAARQLIGLGTEKMPGFRYELAPPQIDAIIAYLKTLPAPAAAAPATKGSAERMAD